MMIWIDIESFDCMVDDHWYYLAEVRKVSVIQKRVQQTVTVHFWLAADVDQVKAMEQLVVLLLLLLLLRSTIIYSPSNLGDKAIGQWSVLS